MSFPQLYAQQAYAQPYAQQANAYLIPRQIFVGDPAVFVMPLPAYSQNENIIITPDTGAASFPRDANIDFHKIILEKRTTGSRLMIEFTAFAPGTLEFPVIEIGGEYFSGLSITINSLIDTKTPPVLSGAASVLAMPGTAIMLYGVMAALIIFILLAIWFVFKGRAILRELEKRWKRSRLFIFMRYKERRFQKAAAKGVNKRAILDKLSDEFREFLSILTGKNCRSMTSREFIQNFENKEDGMFLAQYFRKCDDLRFSGAEIEAQDLTQLLDDLRAFIDRMEYAAKNPVKEADKS